ncbi:unnamed protein product [Nesidiocoris tenuis]|uniref:Uncharacterized protein n=1 Tax=Nesidiocoris tenuis TaxID=355587 RepID=A0A6H5HMG8_9HEMI|nr:unnamed protein product [Nesidiocoris tenuis]
MAPTGMGGSRAAQKRAEPPLRFSRFSRPLVCTAEAPRPARFPCFLESRVDRLSSRFSTTSTQDEGSLGNSAVGSEDRSAVLGGPSRENSGAGSAAVLPDPISGDPAAPGGQLAVRKMVDHYAARTDAGRSVYIDRLDFLRYGPASDCRYSETINESTNGCHAPRLRKLTMCEAIEQSNRLE